MQRILSALVAGVLVIGSVSVAMAVPVTPKQAKKLLFKGSKINVKMLDAGDIEPAIRAQVEVIGKSLADPKIAQQWESMGFTISYYGAIAVMPNRPVSAKTMAISNNLHSPDAAIAAAVKACSAMDGPPCVAAALILPNRYKPRDFSLSQAATEGFRKNWGRPKVPQYLVYSVATGAWTLAKGPGADVTALERCNAKASEAGFNDCVVGIAEE